MPGSSLDQLVANSGYDLSMDRHYSLTEQDWLVEDLKKHRYTGTSHKDREMEWINRERLSTITGKTMSTCTKLPHDVAQLCLGCPSSTFPVLDYNANII